MFHTTSPTVKAFLNARKMAAVLLLIVAQGLGAAHAAGEVASYTKEIAPGLFSFGPGNGYHSMFLVTNDGVAVFETINTQHSTELLAAIRKVTKQPIRYAFHSHNHWDHASGGKVFQDVGAKTIMHQFAAEWLEAHPGQDTSPPNMVWSGKRKDINIGGTTVELHYLGLNHGLGMTVFVIPEMRAAYIADLVTPNRVRFSIVPDFNIAEWERTLGEMQALPFDIAVCSHNELPMAQVPDGCSMTHLKETQEFIQDIRGAIFAEFKKGTPPFTIPSVVKLPKYSHWAHYDDWLEMNVLRVMLDLWMGPYPWVPGQS